MHDEGLQCQVLAQLVFKFPTTPPNRQDRESLSRPITMSYSMRKALSRRPGLLVTVGWQTRYWKKIATVDKFEGIRSLAKAAIPFEAWWKGVDAHENFIPTHTGCMKLTMPLVIPGGTPRRFGCNGGALSLGTGGL